MSLEYIALFEELMDIAQKITFNTAKVEVKQKLDNLTNRVLNDMMAVLKYNSRHGYFIPQKVESTIRSRFKSHKEQLYAEIEQLGIEKPAGYVGERYPQHHDSFIGIVPQKTVSGVIVKNVISSLKKNPIIRRNSA